MTSSVKNTVPLNVEIYTLFGADIPDNHRAHVDPNPHREFWQAKAALSAFTSATAFGIAMARRTTARCRSSSRRRPVPRKSASITSGDGVLAERYVRAFDAKWLRGGAPAEEALVGSGDIQSLADLANSFEVMRTMRLAPVTKEGIFQLVAATLVPLVPLALTMMSLEELLNTAVGHSVLNEPPATCLRI